MGFFRSSSEETCGNPYETLSDMAMGVLGVILVMVVLLTLFNAIPSSGRNSVVRKAETDKDDLRSKLSGINAEMGRYEDIETSLEEINKSYDQKIDALRAELNALEKEKREMIQIGKNFEVEYAQLKELEQRKREAAEQMDLMENLVDYMESNRNRKGRFADLGGQQILTYGTSDGGYVIGKQGFSQDQFRSLLKSVAPVNNVLVLSWNGTCLGCDSVPPQWHRDLVYELGYRPVTLERKY